MFDGEDEGSSEEQITGGTHVLGTSFPAEQTNGMEQVLLVPEETRGEFGALPFSKFEDPFMSMDTGSRTGVVVGHAAEEFEDEDNKYDFGDVTISDMRWLGSFLKSDDSCPI
eukprot:765950-Hanusia_phi.AAC.2